MPKRARRERDQDSSEEEEQQHQELNIHLPVAVSTSPDGFMTLRTPNHSFAVDTESYLANLTDINETRRVNRTRLLEILTTAGSQPLVVSYRKILNQDRLATTLAGLGTVRTRTRREARNMAATLMETERDSLICCVRKNDQLGYVLVQTFPDGEFKQINSRGVESVILNKVEWKV